MSRAHISAWMKDFAEKHPNPSVEDVNQALRTLAKWRSQAIATTQINLKGATVAEGPFAGMDYAGGATEGAQAARLLGSYESELHPAIEAFSREPLDCIVDVGCAEGYYAVGLARLMPQVMVHAFDIDPKARVACAALAARNGVGDRVQIGELFSPDGFEAFAGKRCLVIMDVEGAELDLLNPALSPALGQMSIIVETHDLFRKGTLTGLKARFAPTHDIEEIHQQPKTTPLPDWLKELGHLDQLLAVWEWRSRPTPWLVMRPKP